jgi:hypothetical protein
MGKATEGLDKKEYSQLGMQMNLIDATLDP